MYVRGWNGGERLGVWGAGGGGGGGAKIKTKQKLPRGGKLRGP